MSTQEVEQALTTIVKNSKITWGEERIRNLGATVESLMQRRGFSPAEFDELDQDDFELAA
jgi:uncharacterized protein (DUF433 family)